MYKMTKDDKWRLRVELRDRDNDFGQGDYLGFKIASESDNYRLTFERFDGGDIGDALSGDPNFPTSSQNNSMFSTHEQDSDSSSSENCAEVYGAWWWNDCESVEPTVVLNGEYSYSIAPHHGHGLLWTTWRGYTHSLVRSRLLLQKIEP